MLFSEVASRYANALFDLALENKVQEKVFQNLRDLDNLLEKDEFRDFLASPIVKPKEKESALEKACSGNGLQDETASFVLTLAKKNRISIFTQIVRAFEAKSDEHNGVIRGLVTSSCVLAPEEREEIESKVEQVTKKRVILSYEEDPNHIGGLIARVGSYTFDDTLTSHLKRLQDDLKRRAH